MEAGHRSVRRLDFDLLEHRTPEHDHDDIAQSDDISDNLVQSDDFSESYGLPDSSMPKESKDAERDMVPKISMEFDTHEEAYYFYNAYARKIGFSVRKSYMSRRASGEVYKRVFCCNQEGYKDKRRRDTPPYKPRASWRSGCMARIVIDLQPNRKFRVTQFEPTHNHNLVTPSKAHMLKSQRRMTVAQVAEAKMAKSSGLNPKQTYELMRRQAGGPENLRFLYADLKNCLHTQRQRPMQKGEAGAVLEYFEEMMSENPSLFYAIQLDVNDQITNIFWADARMVVDYGHFGDVVCFDTTYRTNNAERPFAPFVGVNHHKQIVIFGAALLFDETTASFVWLFNCFMRAMSGKKPKTILTDQCEAIASAIHLVFGNETCHRICVWHIFQNAAKYLSHVFNVYKSFSKDFSNCIYDYEEEDEFLKAWEAMLDKYNLRENTWLEQLFKEKEKWALVYGRHMFCACLESTQRSESLNAALRMYLKSKFNLFQFLKHFEKVLADRRYAELQADFRMSQSTPHLAGQATLLKEGSRVYTPAVFQMFEKEVIDCLDCFFHYCGEDGTVTEYKVQRSTKCREHIVKFDSSNQKIDCSCKKFEFVGILCSHALKILQVRNIHAVPQQYIMKRWTKNAKDGNICDNRGHRIEIDPKAAMESRYKELCHNFVKIAARAAECEDAFNHVSSSISNRLLTEVEEILKRFYAQGHTSTATQGTLTNNLASGGTGSLRVENADAFYEPESADAFCELGVGETGEATCRDDAQRVKGIKRKEKGKDGGHRIKGALERQPPNLNMVPCMYSQPMPFVYQLPNLNVNQHSMYESGFSQQCNFGSMPPPLQDSVHGSFFSQSVGNSSSQLSQDFLHGSYFSQSVGSSSSQLSQIQHRR